MRNLLLAAVIILAGCETTTTKTASELSASGCGNYERNRLKGMRFGTSIKPPDPSTEQGRKIIEEMDFLEAICDSNHATAPSRAI